MEEVQLIFLSNIRELNKSIDHAVHKLLYSSQLLDICIIYNTFALILMDMYYYMSTDKLLDIYTTKNARLYWFKSS